MTVDYFYSVIQFIARKNQAGDITPSNLNYAGSLAQNSYYDYLIGQLEKQPLGKPVPPVAAGMNWKVEELLLPLKVVDETVNITGSVFLYPTNYNYLAYMTDASGKNVSILTDSKFNARYNSKIDPVTDTNSPFGKKLTTGWKIYPTTLTSILVSYYFRPPNIVWNYTLNSSGRRVYNPTGSVDPAFDDVGMTKVIGRTCKVLGISFKEQFLMEYGKEVQLQGE